MNSIIAGLLLDMVLTTGCVEALPPMDRPEIQVEYEGTYEDEGMYAKYNDIDVEALFGEDEQLFFERIANAQRAEDILIITEFQEEEGNGN